MRAICRSCLVLVAIASGAAHVSADDSPTLVPPELIGFHRAEYPDAAAEAGLEAVVELSITLDVRGVVTEATVLSPAGKGFDEAAVGAAQRFVFAPALSDGEPIASRIRYRYVFELQPEAPDPGADQTVEPPALGTLSGTVLQADSDAPLPESELIVVSATTGEAVRVVSDNTGAFAFNDLQPGAYALTITADGYDPLTVTENIVSQEETTVRYRLARSEVRTGFRARAVIEAPPREVVRRRITREELTRIPGTRGDALRTVELLPGVGRPPFASGALLVRGSGPNDSEVFLDGVAVPLLYHFGGLTSFFSSQLLEQIDFIPGNFSVRYGRKVGGVLEVESRRPAVDDLHGMVDVNLIDASLMLEAPISDDVSFAVAARRSYVDFWFESALPSDSFDLVTAPVYYDYQTVLSAKVSDKDELRFLVYGSSDRLSLIFDEPSDTDPNLRGNFDLKTQFHKFYAEWERPLSAQVDQQVQFSIGPTLLNFAFGDSVAFDATFLDIVLRSEWRARLSDTVQLRGGLDLELTPFNLTYLGPPITQQEGTGEQQAIGQGDPNTGQDIQSLDVSGVVFRPGIYLEADLLPADGIRLLVGTRLDWYSEIEAWSVDPRLVSLVKVGDGQIKFGAGMFSQPPEFQESAEQLGNPNLRPFRAVHLGLGYEHKLDDGVRAGAELFYKHLWDRVVSETPQNGGGFVNAGVGEIYGLELSGRIEPQGRRYFGFLSYTFSRSVRRDLNGTPWRLFDFDQTHILSASFTYLLGNGWELGGTFRLVSGNPFTPLEPNGRLNLNAGVVNAIAGPINSQRSPFFHRLDVRLAKTWDFDDWKFTFYIDVQNSYNATNPEGTLYDWRYVESAEVPGLPIIPSLGVRGEL